jgi:transcriptional regulator with XRE-family HTH domain
MIQNKFNIQLGINVRKIREERAMSRTTLADVSGVNEKYIGKIERGECSASVYIIKKLSLGLNIQLSDLMKSL